METIHTVIIFAADCLEDMTGMPVAEVAVEGTCQPSMFSVCTVRSI